MQSKKEQVLSVESLLSRGSIPADVLQKIPARLAYHYCAFPLSLDRDGLLLAMPEQPDREQMQELSAVLGVQLKITLAPKARIEEAIERAYGVGAGVVEKMVNANEVSSETETAWEKGSVEQADDSVGEASVRELINQMITDAWSKRATDIHLELFPGELVVRYRIDGVLCNAKVSSDTRRFYRSMISRIKVMANLDISEQRRPQDGRLKIRMQNQEIDMRVSILPTSFGEAVVIRILSSAQLLSMDSVGLNPAHLATMRQVIAKPHGMILMTGPTGSGKTTTLYSCLHELNQEERKIITVEDPVEYVLRGVVQMQINPKTGLSFATGLKHILRHDPDVIMVGEIRDPETAEIAVRSALTGHLVFSTLHTNDAPSAVARLLDLGVPPYLVSSSLMAVVAQRLVRVICEHCKVKTTLEKALEKGEEKLIDQQFFDKTFYEGVGCDRCRSTGYQGRTAIHEIMLIDDDLRQLISNHSATSGIQMESFRKGMLDLRSDGLVKASEGVTTVQEVLRVTR